MAALRGPEALVVGLLVTANIAFAAAYAAGVRVNATSSMPEGLYRVQHVAPPAVARGAIVAVCPSAAVIAVAKARAYLGPGACTGNAEPLLKHVAAVAGDIVDVSDRGESVNGRPLPQSGRVARDCAGRPLARIAAGRYTVAPGDVWLYAPVARSWDSRYFGPQPLNGIIGSATPLLIVGRGSACHSYGG